MIIPFGDIKDRFWQKVQKSEKGCWPWIACKNSDGYGQFGFRGRVDGAHRVSWILSHGELPKGAHVLHKCDNPVCVNPDHLFIGTHQDNMEDRTRKGRSRGRGLPGELSGHNKLTNNIVLKIRKLHEQGTSQKQISNQFAIHKATVNDVVLRKTWRHI